MFGCALGALAKPIFILAPTIGIVVTARLLDSVGEGVRGAPRDAWVAEMTPAHLRGAAVGGVASVQNLRWLGTVRHSWCCVPTKTVCR